MNATVERALAHWGLDHASWHLVAARENRVFRVDGNARTFALRLHRSGYRSDAELRSELQWMNALEQGGLQVPAPIASRTGEVLHVVDGVQVDLLTWLSGTPVGKTGAPMQVADRTGLFFRIGREMARLHEISDAWTPSADFTRCAWDRAGLLGKAPVWGRFWDNSSLTSDDRTLFMRLRSVADDDLARVEDRLDYGLIHADMVRENVLVDGDRLQLIDFDDGGFGFRQFDLATTLLKNLHEQDYSELKAALIEGYQSIRGIDLSKLDLFMVLRSATYMGWIITRMNEDGAESRNDRFVTTTRALALDYLDERGLEP